MLNNNKDFCCNNEDLERLRRFRLMDDDFMSKVFDKNIEATQLLLNIILEREDIKVVSVDAQRENIKPLSVIRSSLISSPKMKTANLTI